MKLAFSLSTVSLVFSLSYLLSLVLSFHFLSPLFSRYAIDNNRVFLLCNGLLMFLANTSKESMSKGEDESRSEFLVMGGRDSPSESQFTVFCSEKENDEANSLMAAEEKDVQDAEPEEKEDDEEEEEDDEADGVLSMEELNRKFDEFIRKMKQEIRIEEL